MKTQISRDSFQPGQHYSGVYLQQGRMILDADWNELSDIQKARLVGALRDAVAGGAPREGGLGLVAVPADSINVRIRPGALYVEGVPARLDGETPLEIDRQPDYPIGAAYSGQSLKLYADVWERSVSALEQSALMDAALHGADTATRSQTMLQVKWCADTINPMDPAVNPPQGNAALTLRLRLITSSGDPCDPCASQVKVDERTGNYLFRVEVHDYEPATQWLTLKWSRDNGAEACAVAAMPAGFNQGAWVWEYFDNDTERLLGNHFAASPPKLRGLIKETCVTPVGANEPKQHVRQWDGYIRIKLDTGALSGRDRGVALFAGPVGDQAQGRVNFSGGAMKINLELMEFTLATAGKRFVPGDYWLARVREAEHQSGQYVLPPTPFPSVPAQGELPRGVRHHYLFLGAIAGNRKLVAQDDAFARRMAFPPLTDITADKVGFTDNCSGLFAGARNVQQALDNLCAIGAEDIAYLLPGCAGNTVRERLKATLDPNSDGKLTVRDALDTLLCQLNAGSLPYAVPACDPGPSVRSLLGLASGDSQVAPVLDKLLCQLNAGTLPYAVPACDPGPSVRSLLGLAAGNNQVGPVLSKLLCELKATGLPLDKNDAGLCNELKADSVVSVQDALRTLCGKSGGCAVAVSSTEQLGVLLDEFAKSDADDLWICLKAGTYPLGNLPAIANKRSLRISGEGAESALVTFAGAKLSIDAWEVILENLSLSFSTGTGQLAIQAAESQVRGCHIARTSTSANGPAMIRVTGQGNAACRLSWRDNMLYAQIKGTTAAGGATWVGVDVVGSAKLSEDLLRLGSEELLGNSVAFDKALMDVAKQIIVLPKDIRTAWKANLPQGPTLRTAVRAPKAGTAAMSEILSADTISANEALAAVEDLVAQWITYEPDYALRLETARVGGILSGSEIDGWLLLGNGVAGYHNPDAGVAGTTLTIATVKAGGEELRLENNRVTAIKANVAAGSVNADSILTKQVSGHARLFLAGNSIAELRNTLVAASFVGQGNTWRAAKNNPPGSVIADRATFTGNLLEGYNDNANLTGTIKAGRLASVGNVLVDLSPSVT